MNFGENYDLMKNVVLKWAYVIDLLPERKEVINDTSKILHQKKGLRQRL